jgi:hypothetical protein
MTSPVAAARARTTERAYSSPARNCLKSSLLLLRSFLASAV